MTYWQYVLHCWTLQWPCLVVKEPSERFRTYIYVCSNTWQGSEVHIRRTWVRILPRILSQPTSKLEQLYLELAPTSALAVWIIVLSATRNGELIVVVVLGIYRTDIMKNLFIYPERQQAFKVGAVTDRETRFLDDIAINVYYLFGTLETRISCVCIVRRQCARKSIWLNITTSSPFAGIWNRYNCIVPSNSCRSLGKVGAYCKITSLSW